VLRPLQNLFDPKTYPDLLVGLDQPDDAAVWRLDDSRALILTTDFFTPVVDDPFAYGAIAAANSLSDIYAMGGTPFMALNIAAIPPQLDPAVTTEIIRGAAEKAREAGVVIAGGHSVQDKEPKVGLVVAGFVDPNRIFTKAGAHPGDQLVLTKPLGFGVVTTALQRDVASPEDVAEAVTWMTQLNRAASNLGVEHDVRGATDITGYSLLGHGLEIAQASKVGLRISYERIPFLSCARKYAQQWAFPGGAADNRLYFEARVRFDPLIDEPSRMLLFDPQTSGGLLLAVPAGRISSFLAEARARSVPAWNIGEVINAEGIHVIP
jgi:selenide,water dikinase